MTGDELSPDDMINELAQAALATERYLAEYRGQEFDESEPMRDAWSKIYHRKERAVEALTEIGLGRVNLAAETDPAPESSA